MEPEKNEQLEQTGESRPTAVQEQASGAPAQGQKETFWQKRKRKRAEKKAKEKKKTLAQEIWSWVFTLLAAVVIAMLIRMFLGEAIKVDGHSMDNTLQDGEIVLVSKLAYEFGDIQQNDIVICRFPNHEKWQLDFGASLSLTDYILCVKRVIALPGDTIRIAGGRVYVNGEEVSTPKDSATTATVVRDEYGYIVTDAWEYTLKYGYNSQGVRDSKFDEFFVMGDNRGSSHDSRATDVGPLRRMDIEGKVVKKLIPWGDVE